MTMVLHCEYRKKKRKKKEKRKLLSSRLLRLQVGIKIKGNFS